MMSDKTVKRQTELLHQIEESLLLLSHPDEIKRRNAKSHLQSLLPDCIDIIEYAGKRKNIDISMISFLRAGPIHNESKNRKYLGRVDQDTRHLSRGELEIELLATLRSLGGRGSKKAIEDEMERRLIGKLSPADQGLVSIGIPRWKESVEWCRKDLVDRGIFKKNSPRGIWELEIKRS